MKATWTKAFQVSLQIHLVRERSKEIVALLRDDAQIEVERETAKVLREKMSGGRAQGISSSNSNYEGYGSSSFKGESKFNASGVNSKAYKYDMYGGDRKYHDSSSKYQEPSYDSYYEKKPELSIPKPAEPHKDDVSDFIIQNQFGKFKVTNHADPFNNPLKVAEGPITIKLPKPGEKKINPGPISSEKLVTNETCKICSNIREFRVRVHYA